MEGLLILIALFLNFPLATGILFLFELVVWAISFLISFFLGRKPSVFNRDRRRLYIPPRFWKILFKWSLAMVVLTSALIIFINFFFLNQTVRLLADLVSAKTGIEIFYSEMKGDIFSGAFSFSDVSLSRNENSKSDFLMEFRSVDADLAVTRFLFGKREIESFDVTNGKVEMTMKRSVTNPDKIVGLSVGLGSEPGISIQALDKGETFFEEYHSPKFVFNRITLTDLDIRIDDSVNDRGVFHVFVSEFESKPLRSYFLWFDVLFRSNLRAKLNSSDLEIINRSEDSRHWTSWKVNAVKATALQSLIGGPFLLFEDGLIDVEVSDNWDITHSTEIEMDWNLRITDGKAQVPLSTPALLKPFAGLVVESINAKTEPWEFGFQLGFSESQFEGAASLDAQKIWQDSLSVILENIAEKYDLSQNEVKESAQLIFEGFKKFLEGRKKRADSN
ncbi:MAG: AsmA family protein [Verrucomicrobiae bacterium]|nr:AsmA family protein [Verrucomicrobiae bacterium]